MQSSIITESRSFKDLQNNLISGKFSQVCMLIHPDTMYLDFYTKCVCKMLLCRSAKNEVAFCDSCNSCVKIEKGVHVDVSVIGGDEEIKVDDVNNIISGLAVTPYESDKKIVVIRNFQLMNEKAQNKLLKSLEEPPEHTYFILSTTNEYLSLPTILSRSIKIHLEGLKSEELASELKERKIENAELLVVESGGLLTKALNMASTNLVAEIYELVRQLLLEMNSTTVMYKYASKFEQYSKQAAEVLELMRVFVADAMKLQIDEKASIELYSKIQEIQLFAKMCTIEGLLRLIDYINESLRELEFNASVLGVIDKMLFRIMEVKVKCRK